MDTGSSNFYTEENESLSSKEKQTRKNHEESFMEEEDTDIVPNFPTAMLKEIAKDLFHYRQVPGIDREMVNEFNKLLDEGTFMTEEAKLTDKKIIEVVKNMIRKTSIPGPGDDLYNDLYKVLVKNISSDLKLSDTNELDAEVTARKLAAWVLTFDEQLKAVSKNEEVEKPFPGNPYYYKPENDGRSNDKSDGNIKLYNLSEHRSRPYWQGPGDVVELNDNEGSQIYVKGIKEGDSEKTLVKKIKNTSKGKEISSWVVEVANREQVKSVEDKLRICSGVIEKPPHLELRSPVTVDEWKTLADIRREEASSWKNMPGCDRDLDESTSGGLNMSSDLGYPEPSNSSNLHHKSYRRSGPQDTLKKKIIEVTDEKRTSKGSQKVSFNKSTLDSYLVNEMRKRTGRKDVEEEDWKSFLSSSENRKIRWK